MTISFLQMVLVVLFAVVIVYDQMNTQLLIMGGKVIAGFGVGLILGDPTTGLVVGATLELMSLGVAAYGGASVPDYFLGAIMGTTVAVMAGKGADFGILVGVPLSVLAIQLDVLVRTGTVFFVHRAKDAAERGNVHRSTVWLWNGYTLWYLKYAVPVILLFVIGADNMQAFVNVMPTWLIAGFSIAGGILPVVGIAVLLRYMNTKIFFPYLIVGFVLAAYLKMPVVGVALLGLAAAILLFQREKKALDSTPHQAASTTATPTQLSTVGVNDDEL